MTCSFGNGKNQYSGEASSKAKQTFPWEEAFFNTTVCTDDCAGHAKDGICDDGRDGRSRVSSSYVPSVCVLVLVASHNWARWGQAGPQQLPEPYNGEHGCVPWCRSSATLGQTAQTAGHGRTCSARAK
jgi:hypothetical protein